MRPPDHDPVLACRSCGKSVYQNSAGGLCPECICEALGPLVGGKRGGCPAEAFPPDYECVEVLGRGGMGVVYLAYQRSLGRYVALKQLGPAWRRHERARARFVQEARAAARLSHPGIVPVLDVGVQEDVAWYTMEYLEGGDLSQLLSARGGRLPWPEAVGLIAAVAEALAAAHRAGVAHRDLKPSNILLSADERPKIADFGLAWTTGQELKELTATGEVLGTPAYLAPEALEGRRSETDAKLGDIYSLAAVLFQLLAGQPPFVADHPLQLLSHIANKPAPRLSTVVTTALPWQLSEICERCLRKRPEDRFPSADALALALRETLEKGNSRRPFSNRLIRARSPLLVACAVVLLAGAGALVVSTPRPSLSAATDLYGAAGPVLVVMAFKQVGSDETSALVAQGLQDEIVAALNQITQLRVIAPSSARTAGAQAEDSRSLRQVLGADAVLTATVRRWQDTLRVSAQLISTADASVLWAANYDRRDTNLLNLQTDIAMDVASRLNAQLAPDSHDALAGTSSPVPEAQQAFLRAQILTADASASVHQLTQAESLLVSATQLDPKFALAYARLSQVHTLSYHWGNDRSEARLAKGLRAAQTALRLNPLLIEAKLALGNYYLRGFRDFSTAKPYIESVLGSSPSYAPALESMAQIERRNGNFESSADFYKRALEVDPLNPILAYNTADTAVRLRNYAEAAELLEAALRRMPRHVALMKLRGDLYLLWKGDLRFMEEDILHRDPSLPTPELYLRDKINWLVMSRRFEEAIAALQASKVDLIEGQAIYITREGYLAELYMFAGRTGEAREQARLAWKRVEDELKRRPNDARVLIHAAGVQAILGEVDSARRLALRTITAGDLACVDAFDLGFFRRSYAIVLAVLGRDAEAKEQLRLMLKEPNQSSVNYINRHPLLTRYAADLEPQALAAAVGVD